MNKHTHQLIFNAARGFIMAVAETARSQGKANGRAVVSSLALMACLGAPAQAQIVADPSAPATQRPTVLAAPNGVPLVNIQTPSAAGVSRNIYQQFDVGAPGAVLNNSRPEVQTQLGGWVQGNPWLSGGSAKVILNEVNSSHPSQLNGFVEVAGQRAEVVIANPAGIHVNGAGFINASRATLTTGTPLMSGGNLEGFRVQRGGVRIEGAGLDASQTDYTGILARAIEVNAHIHAQQLNVVTGVNTLDAIADAVPNGATPAAQGEAPSFSLDVSELGGMYAGHIRLVGTEAGVGVRHHGTLAANAGNVHIDANGWLSSAGRIEARQGHVTVQTAGDQIHSGSLAAAGNLTLHSGDEAQRNDLTQTGTARAGREAHVRARDMLNSGDIDAQRLDVVVANLTNRGDIWQVGTQALNVKAHQLDNQAGAVLGSVVAPTQSSQPGQTPKVPEVPLASGQVQVSGQLQQRQGATLAGVGDIAVHSVQTFTNAGDVRVHTLHADGQLFEQTAGTLEARSLEVQTQHTDIQGGSVWGQNVNIDTQSMALTEGAQLVGQTGLDIEVHSLDNAGQVQSGVDLELTVFQSLRNSGSLVAAADVRAQANDINNAGGRIIAGRDLLAQVSTIFNNSHGTLSAQRQLALTDAALSLQPADLAARQLHIINTGGQVVANNASAPQDSAMLIQAQGLSLDDGTLQSGGDIALDFVGSLHTQAGQAVRAGRDLDVRLHRSSAGIHTFTHAGQWQAGQNLTIHADHIDNLASGELISHGSTTLTTNPYDGGTVTNRGLVDGADTRIQTQTLSNIGTGRIYGDRVAIAASTLVNREEALDSVSTAGTIAARERLDVGAQYVTNREGALLFSAADMAVGGALDANHRAVTDGSANSQNLNNNSATLESLGNMVLATNRLSNTNEHLAWSIEVDEKTQHTVNFSSTLYRTYTETTQQAVVHQSAPGQIVAAGNLDLTVQEQGLNQDSLIVAGGAISGDVAKINNQSTQVNAPTLRVGTTHDWGTVGKDCDFLGSKCDPEYGWRSNPYNETIGRQVALPIMRFEQHAVLSGTGTTLAALPHLGSTANAHAAQLPSNPGAALGTSVAPGIVLPDSGLFIIPPDRTARFVVETDPRFANYRQWLSSDHLLQALALEPDVTHKRLGDGFYEQRLIREQVAALTGHRFLGDYRSDEAQYLALMTAGATFAQAQQLRPGIALSAAQVTQLTSDIVWLVTETVQLPDGSKTTALVPRVYLMPRAGDLAQDGSLFGNTSAAVHTTGSLISARDIQLSLKGGLNNSGTIAGRRLVHLSAENIENSGLIRGQAVTLRAGQDINVIGGQVRASVAAVVTAGGSLNIRSTVTRGGGAAGNGAFTSQQIDRVAGLYVSGDAGVLLASAGNDINLIAADVRNAGSGEIELDAGGNVNLGTVQTGISSNVTHDARNDARVQTSQEVGSRISSGGAVGIQALKDINARAASINAKGELNLQTTDGNVTIEAGQDSHGVATRSHVTGRGLLGSSATAVRSSNQSTTARASELGGQTVNIQSGADIRMVGSHLLADQDLRIQAGGDLVINAAQNTQSSSQFRQTRRSGVFGSGGIGFTIGSQQQSNDVQNQRTTTAASTVGAIDGDVNLNAGQTYTQRGSDVLAPGGDIHISAQAVNIEEARESSQQSIEQRARQSGLTVAITSPVISAVQTIHQQVEAAGNTQSGRMKALAAANVALAGFDAYQQVQAGQGQNIHGQDGQIPTGKTEADGTPITRDATMVDKVGGINLSISLGSSRSQSSQSSSADTARGSSVTAGGDVNITAKGAGADSDITIQGSTVQGTGNTRLSAEDQVRLLAAANTRTEANTNRSSSSSVGVSMRIGGQNTGISVNASASRGEGQGAGSGTTYSTTRVSGQTVEVESGGDTTLKGTVVKGEQVAASIGGDLLIQTLQDSNRYNERQRSAGFNVSVPIGPGVASGSLHAGRIDIRSNYQSATEQSGIRVGDGGFQVRVEGDTALVGAAITSSQAAQDAGVNRLQTATLISRDLHNTASASVSSSGISLGADMLNQGRYGLAKTGIANLANQASDQTQQQGQTISAIRRAHIVITDEARHQALTNETAERLRANAQGPTHTGVSAADVQAMRRQVEAERAIKNEAVKQFSVIGDQVYRKETEDKTVHLMQCETADKERCGVSEVVGLEQVRAVNKAITAFNNGMLNTEQEALMTAYMQASGMQLQDGILVIVNPRLDNIVAEGAWVVYKKVQEVFGFGSSSVGELNLALEAIAAAQGALYNTQAHSAGNFGVAEMNRRLEAAGRTDAAIGTQTIFGSPVNAQSQADRVHTITSGQGTVQQSTHVKDFVSTLFGNNPPTGGEENTPALRSHSAYTGDLTTSGSDQPQVQIPSFITPEELRQRTDEAWGAGWFSQPETVVPRNQVAPHQGN